MFPYAFDLIDLNGDDLRRDPLEVASPRHIRARQGWRRHPAQWHVEHEDGVTVFAHACKLGLEGIVSKRKDSIYRSGRSPDWLKMKNAAHPAVKREEELGPMTFLLLKRASASRTSDDALRACHQYRDRKRSCVHPSTATHCFWPTQRMRRQPILSGQDRSRTHRLCQSQYG